MIQLLPIILAVIGELIKTSPEIIEAFGSGEIDEREFEELMTQPISEALESRGLTPDNLDAWERGEMRYNPDTGAMEEI
ncbi:MAG: hypothetical protein IH874_04015 [Candidatus Dadabacteria bacterium]|nr:hypothetical protein [Candidatus Dadabacteria bacterium]